MVSRIVCHKNSGSCFRVFFRVFVNRMSTFSDFVFLDCQDVKRAGIEKSGMYLIHINSKYMLPAESFMGH